MSLSRRKLLNLGLQLPLSLMAGAAYAKTEMYSGKRIAVEEAFATQQLFSEWRKLLDLGVEDEPGFSQLYGFFLNNNATQDIRNKLLDVGSGRISEMDKWHIDMQILSITAPGVQLFKASKALDITKRINDQLASVVTKYPSKFRGLATIAPQDINGAKIEMNRAIKDLNLNGIIINSHTKNEYLDDPKYWGIFEVAQSLNTPIYLHPRTPSSGMIKPYEKYGILGAGWGFAAETSLHALRLILSGLFDEFPRLKIILGHLGEGLPLWLSRIDSRFANKVWKGANGKTRSLSKKPSEYFKDNFLITTSGMNEHSSLKLGYDVMGPERMLFAVDYPYESTEKAVSLMDSFKMSDDDKKKVYYKNAEKAFNIPTLESQKVKT